MAEYRFFGTMSELKGSVEPAGGGDPVEINLSLTGYGQVVEMPETVAETLIARTPPALILPAQKWDEIGITREELNEFPSVASHVGAPDEFRKKTDAVRQSFHDYRHELIEKLDAAAKAKPAEEPAHPAESAAAPAVSAAVTEAAHTAE